VRTLPAVGLLAVVVLLAAGCGDDSAGTGGDGGDCAARLRVDGVVLDPVGADPTGRRGDPVSAEVVGCEGEPVAQVDARPVTRAGEVLGHEVPDGTYRGFYSTDSVVEPTG
jgi:hypothetical protein